jgi:hypothetical protein
LVEEHKTHIQVMLSGAIHLLEEKADREKADWVKAGVAVKRLAAQSPSKQLSSTT